MDAQRTLEKCESNRGNIVNTKLIIEYPKLIIETELHKFFDVPPRCLPYDVFLYPKKAIYSYVLNPYVPDSPYRIFAYSFRMSREHRQNVQAIGEI